MDVTRLNVTQALHRAARQTPDTAATRCGDRTRTWSELADRVALLAGALHRIGVGADDPVGVFALNSDRYIELLYGVPWAGAVVVPVNARWLPSEVAYALEDAEVRVLFVDDAAAAAVPAILAGAPGVEVVVHCGDGPAPPGLLLYEILLAEADPIPDADRSGDDLAGIFYTGGTTGEPKGVMLSQQNLIVSAIGTMASAGTVSGGGPTFLAVPLFHAAGIVLWLINSLRGATLVIMPSFDPEKALETMQRERTADTLLVPTMIQAMVDHPDAAGYELPDMRRLMYGASPIAESVLHRVRATWPHLELVQVYGMTELAPIATVLTSDEHTGCRLRSAGRAAPHAEVRIVGDDDTEVPRGTVGEIAVRGANLMLGYRGRPKDTDAAVRDGWMHTGDAAYMDQEGFVFIVDRLKDMIVSGAENVFSTEVENAVAAHPAVASCAVIGVPDPKWGERVHAVVVLKAGETATAEEIIDSTRERIAAYKIPRSVEFVQALPKSGAGKVLKRELREPHWKDHRSRVV